MTEQQVVSMDSNLQEELSLLSKRGTGLFVFTKEILEKIKVQVHSVSEARVPSIIVTMKLLVPKAEMGYKKVLSLYKSWTAVEDFRDDVAVKHIQKW